MFSPVEISKQIIAIRMDAHRETEDRSISRPLALGAVWASWGALLPPRFYDSLVAQDTAIQETAHSLTQGHSEAEFVAQSIWERGPDTWGMRIWESEIWRSCVQRLAETVHTITSAALREAFRLGIEAMEQEEVCRENH